MGFPSPAADYIEGRLSLNTICDIRATSQVYECNGIIYVIDSSVTPAKGDHMLYELWGEIGIGRMNGAVLKTSNVGLVEGATLEEVITLGTVMFTIMPHHEDSRPVI